jgi:hypothetical protein
MLDDDLLKKARPSSISHYLVGVKIIAMTTTATNIIPPTSSPES